MQCNTVPQEQDPLKLLGRLGGIGPGNYVGKSAGQQADECENENPAGNVAGALVWHDERSLNDV